ncbi:hypothetical protein [Nevskia soli]|uniref:hypothetical protein n=1 Tax=Nevskia soli TaxID=418856 RepID=UPI0015D71D8E|nr:hypothetical protein [Nevskia soli]
MTQAKATAQTQTAPRVIGKRPRQRKHEIHAIAPVPPPPAPVVVERHNDVRQRAMLVILNVHEWGAQANDATITDEVAQRHGIASDMGRYQKTLLSKGALERLRSAASKLRSTHIRYTLPWDSWGTRIMSATAYMEYSSKMRTLIDEYEQVFRDELEAIDPATGVSKYEAAKAEARRLLNGAFREQDYPTMSQLRRKFGATFTLLPIPAAQDFRIDLGAQATEQVQQEIEQRANDRVNEAMKGVFARLQGVVAKLVTALKAEKTDAIRKTLFTSAQSVLDLLPMLNFTGDAALDAFSAEIRSLIEGLDAKELRESEPMRASVLVKADAILAKMNDFLG